MFYFLYGTDTIKSRKKLHELLDIAQKKRPGAELFKLTTENWSEGQFDELLISRGLFEQKYTVVLDSLFQKKEIKEYVIEKLKEVSDSEQIFLILEGTIDAITLKKIEKYAKQVQVFEKKETKGKSGSIFSISDTLVKRDKKNLWVSYLTLLSEGVSAEEIHGVFFWQVKNMILASKSKNVSESGLSPFVWRNAEVGAKKYNSEELLSMSTDLVDMTHHVRLGKGDLEVMLEKWILKM